MYPLGKQFIFNSDVCKTDEFVISQSGLVDGYTPEGTLVGHLVMGAVNVDRIGSRILYAYNRNFGKGF